ncbi:ABC transporter permease subunit [Gleimia hominis]|uniref:ABC transporter permease subunit n=1 Tax=Gleimia hominis TaxID=595468 RepID=UPI002542955E|nr:ABC transporter permease subunit [Gleimia hominis]WIK65130.1 ABC transporter permease subunit [Gleimia hominis]
MSFASSCVRVGRATVRAGAVGVVAATLAFVYVVPFGALLFTALAPGREGLRFPTGLVFRSALTSLIVCFAIAVCAAVLGAGAALGSRWVSNRTRICLDALILLPVLFPPFIHAALIRAAIGPAGAWVRTSPSNALLRGLPLFIVASLFAYVPLAYFFARLALGSVDERVVDAARMLGVRGFRLARLAYGRQLFLGCLPAMLLTLVFTISDPLTPSVVGADVSHVGMLLWLQISGFGSQRTAALLALVLGFACLLVLLVAAGLVRHLEPEFARWLRRLRWSLNAVPSRPVGTPKGVRAVPTIGVALVGLVEIGLILALAQRGGGHRVSEIITTVLLALVALLVAALVAWIGLLAQQRFRTVVDVLFASLLMVPGATIGTSLAFAYGPRSPLAFPTSRVGATLVILAAFASLSIPVVYALVRLTVATIDPRVITTARVLGASKWRAIAACVLPRIRFFTVGGTAIVVALSTVMVAPLIWVTSPQVPVLIPRLYAMVDHSAYAQAGTSLATVLLAVGTVVILTWAVTRIGAAKKQ